MYRSDHQALLEQEAILRAELQRLRSEQEQLQATLREERRRLKHLRRRLQGAGAGGGTERDGKRDRIALAAGVMIAVALGLIILQAVWHRYISKDPTVIPAMLWLGTPGLVASLIAWPYRKQAGHYLALSLLGLLLGVLPLLHVVFTLVLS